MYNDILSDNALHKMLCNRAIIFGSQTQQHEDCLWITGSTIHSDYRQLFISLSEIEIDKVILSVIITDDTDGKSSYLIFDKQSSFRKQHIAMLINILIDDIIDGNGLHVKVYE